jgi:hypothetical protein
MILVSGCAAAAVSMGLASVQIADRGDGPSLTQHREQPDDPPASSELLPRNHPEARSAASVVRVGPFVSIQVNVDEFGQNIVGDAGNEPSIAVDPTDPDVVVIGWRQFDTIQSNFRQAGWGYSDDGGATWTFPGVHEPGIFRSDPVLDSDANGNIYYYSLRGDFFCHMFKSADGGVSWIGPIDAFGGDKAWMTVDKTGSVGQGHIYVAWSTAGNNYFPNQFTRSKDGGITWPDLEEIPPERPRWGTLTVDPLGDLYVSGTSSDNLYVAKSTDAKLDGETPSFDFTVEVDLGGSLGLGGDPNPGGLLGQMWVAADNSGGPNDGNVYVLASVNPSGPDPLDIMFARSEDGGQTWSAPVLVNDDAGGSNAWQWFGTMSVAPTGRIDAVWNDTRNTGQDELSELFYSYSTDAGQTWADNIPVSPVFDSHIGWPNQNKLGDYYDMISETAMARVAYAATFNGEQDVYYLELGDCNANGTHDGLDIDGGGSDDANGNGIADECECLADLDGDGVVGISDLLDLLAAWGPCGECPADINGDGDVGIADLLALLAGWGPCP